MTSVDVVLPAFERPQLLQNAVRSVLAQTHRDLRLWVVDAGSTPALALEPKLEADSRVELVRLDERCRAGRARNRGVALGEAPYVAFVDDDDEWYPEKLARQVELFERQSADVGLVATGYLFDLRGRRRRVVPSQGADVRRALLTHPLFIPTSAVLRRSVFEALGGFDESVEGVEDWELWLRLTDSYEVRVLSEPLALRRESHRSPDRMLEDRRELREILRPRLARLAPRERRRVEARHGFDEAIWLARAGRRREARRLLMQSWRDDPRRLSTPLQLARTVIGERAWEAAARRRPSQFPR